MVCVVVATCHVRYPTQPLSHSTQSLTQLQSLTQRNQLFINGMVDLPPCWHWQAIQIHPQLLVDVLLVPGPWHSDYPVPTSQVLRKWISSHVQGNIVNQTSVQHDPPHMHPPSNLWGSSPLKGGVHPSFHCHCQPPSW